MSNAWVIGGTSGIGEAIANMIDSTLGPHSTVRTGLEDFDVTESQHDFCDMLELHRLPKYIVYSAGTNYLQWLGGNLSQSFKHSYVIDVNLKGFIKLMDAMASIPDYRSIEPSVVAISSDAAERPLRTSIGYCASKAGLNMAVRVAARELGPHGWRINAVSPGMTELTKMTEYVDHAVPLVRGWTLQETLDYERSQEVVPGRISPDEVAQVAVDVLFGPKHLNGSIVTINGGR